MGKNNRTCKMEKKDVAKEIPYSLRNNVREKKETRKKEVEELVKAQKTTNEGTSGGVAEKNKFPPDDEDEEWDEYEIEFLQTYKGTEDQEDHDLKPM